MTTRTLREFLADPAGDGKPAARELATLIEAISDSCRTISYLVSRGALEKSLPEYSSIVAAKIWRPRNVGRACSRRGACRGRN